MTLRLYETDAYRTECTARVLSCEAAEGGYAVQLDQTVLFPDAGGQPHDTGSIGPAKVLGAAEKGGGICYLTDRALQAGETVTLAVDFPRRFDHMQQHTGEHLLSWCFYTLAGANNVGFHMAEDYATVDMDCPLSQAQIDAAAAMCNRLIWENRGVTATLYADEAAVAALPLRKHAEGIAAPIRIVSIEGADMCTCCAPHLRCTGEAGLLLITAAAAYKGGTRLTFLCGERAARYANAAHQTLDRIAQGFSTAREQVESAVLKQTAELSEARKREKALASELADYMAAELRAAAKPAGSRLLMLRLYTGLDAGRLRELAQKALQKKSVAVLFSEKDGRLNYLVLADADAKTDAGALIGAINAATGGSGGGRGTLAQGCSKDARGAAETVAQLETYLLQAIKNA